MQFQTFQYIKPTWQWSNSRRSQARIPSSWGRLGWKWSKCSPLPLQNKPLMLLWQRLDVLLIWQMTLTDEWRTFLSEFEGDKQLGDLVIEFHYQGRSKLLGRKHLRQKYNRQHYVRASHSARWNGKMKFQNVPGYVAKTISSRSNYNQYEEKLIFNNTDSGHDHDKYLRFNFQHFTLHITHNTRRDKKQKIRKITENVPPKHLNNVVNFAYANHEEWAVRFSVWACINIFYNSEKKITNQSVRKEQIKDFKKRRTKNG